MGLAPTALAAPNVSSTAPIRGSFADACRDFSAHSSKDISHVEIHYSDGRLVKDETIAGPEYAIDGGVGDEIEFAIVKSETTRERFDCVQANRPPTALTSASGGWSGDRLRRPERLRCGVDGLRRSDTGLRLGR